MVPSGFNRKLMVRLRVVDVPKTRMTGIGTASNRIAVGVVLMLNAPVAAVYASDPGFANVVVGRPGVTPSSAALSDAPPIRTRRTMAVGSLCLMFCTKVDRAVTEQYLSPAPNQTRK